MVLNPKNNGDDKAGQVVYKMFRSMLNTFKLVLLVIYN